MSSDASAYLPIAADDPRMVRWLDLANSRFCNGGARLLGFQERNAGEVHALLRRMQSRSTPVVGLLSHAALRAVDPELVLPVAEAPASRSVGRFELEGQLADLLQNGGAYHRYDPLERRARELSRDLCEALVDPPETQGHASTLGGPGSRQIWKLRLDGAWCPWFHAVAWDASWLLIDSTRGRWWLLCVTDTD